MPLTNSLPISITNGDDIIDNLKHMLEFGNGELEPHPFGGMVRNTNNEGGIEMVPRHISQMMRGNRGGTMSARQQMWYALLPLEFCFAEGEKLQRVAFWGL